MKRLIILFLLTCLLLGTQTVIAQERSKQDTVLVADTTASAAAMSDSLASEMMLTDDLDADAVDVRLGRVELSGPAPVVRFPCLRGGDDVH